MKTYVCVTMIVIIILCLMYFMAKNVDEPLDNSQNQNAFDRIYNDANMKFFLEKSNCNKTKREIKKINNENNGQFIKFINEILQQILDQYQKSIIYNTFLNKNSDFYSDGGAFDCWMNLVKNILNPENERKMFNILTKKIELLTKIRNSIGTPMDFNLFITNTNNVTTSIQNLKTELEY